MTPQQQQAFITQWGPYAQEASISTGIPATYILGQWALETGWGTSFAGTYNPGNIQGNNPKPYDYNSPEQGVNAYISTMGNLRYTFARGADTPDEFGQALQLAGYATDPDYADKVSSTIKSLEKITGSVGDQIGFGGLLDMPDNILNWFKDAGMNVGFVVIGVLGLVALAYINVNKNE